MLQVRIQQVTPVTNVLLLPPYMYIYIPGFNCLISKMNYQITQSAQGRRSIPSVGVISAAVNKGGPLDGCQKAPAAMRMSGLDDLLASSGK